MNLPVYEMVISTEETSDIEVAAVALVDKPAIEKNFLAFNNHRLEFAVNAERQIISGPAMVADQLIYRKDENGEYNVFFSAQTIRDIQLKFFKKDYHKNLNLFHDPNMALDGVTIFETFVTDESRGIQPMKGFEDLPDGTWFISAKVDNPDVWEKIKSGEVKGFSVEGIFSFMKRGLNRTQNHNSLLNEENGFMSELKNLWSKFKEKFLGELPTTQKLAMDVPLKDGTVLTADKLEVGGVLMNGEAPCMPGEYELADGGKVTVGEGGVISAIAPAAMDQPQTPPPTNYEKQFEEVNAKFTDYEQKFSAHIQAFDQMKTEFAAQLQKSQDQVNQLVELVGKIIETPTADTVTQNNSGFSSQKQNKQDRIKDLADVLSNLKKNKN